jgi:phosphomannomutase / phosphoglucomutase
MRELPRSIFKAYDIRGIVGDTLTPAIVRSIGQALATLARERGRDTFAIGRDGRLSGPALAAALADGLREGGANVIDLGMVATPMTYFAANVLGTGCSVMVTGSHNPPDYNGLKMVVDGTTLSGDDIQELRLRCEDGRLATGSGTYATHDIAPAYLDRIVGDVRIARPLRIAVDCGTGAVHADGLHGGAAVLRSRWPLPQPSSRSIEAGKPGGPDRALAPGRLRDRPRLRR